MRFAIVSVGYGDMLPSSLPAWQALVPSGLVVATSAEDLESQRVARECGVPVYVTDAWRRTDPACHQATRETTFNMALALDEALGLIGDQPPAVGEIVGHANVDCVPFGRWPDEAVFTPGTIYGFWRHECLSAKALREHQAGRRGLGRFPRLKNSHGWPIGYNQIFRYATGIRFGSYPTAGKFDTDFARTFARQEMRGEMYLLHMGPINVRENWAGRVVPAWA